MAVEIAFRVLFGILFGYLGWRWGPLNDGFFALQGQQWSLMPFWVVLGIVLGVLVGPYLSTRPFRWVVSGLSIMPSQTFVAGMMGVFSGLVLAALLTLPLVQLPGLWGRLLPITCAVFLSLLGAQVMTRREHDLAHSLAGFISGGSSSPARSGSRNDQVVIDTSAIIDGRIADISQTGFIQGTMIIPRFVLQELQHIADSSDPLRRNRGRRGLDMLNKLQKESDVPLQISEMDFDDVPETDAKLIRMAQLLRCPIVTNDFNLNRVAELQGVRVLNINELANAVKTVVLPGEEMTLRIIQEGKEAGQGVGFLDDGTMVVVENGKRYINNQLDIVVTRVLQTVAGRMIFAHPK